MTKSRACVCWGFLLLALSLLMNRPFAWGQVVGGTFSGTVTDPSGAILPSATVTVTNEGTNVSVSQPVTSAGIYTISNLAPGFYTLKAEATGFRVLLNTHVELSVGYTQRVDFKLEVGAVTQEVTVTGAAPLVDTDSNRMSDLVTAQQVENLPLNGRNVFQLIQLAPGAVNTTGLITEPGNRGFTTVVNGARVNMNGYQIDGISDKGLSGGSNTQPAVDSVQEFRVDTEVLSAEYGSTVGAVTQVSTKAGTNQYHGDAYEFLRNNVLDARSFFEGNRNPFRFNQFGGTLGGPIKKDKWFFFGSFEGDRTRIFVPALESTESPQFRSLVQNSAPNSVAALLYKNFPGTAPAFNVSSLQSYLATSPHNSGACGTAAAPTLNAACVQSYGLSPTTGLGAALIANPSMPTFGLVDAAAEVETSNQFFDGNQFSGRIDYNGDQNKVFGSYFFDRYADPFFTPAANGGSPSALVGVRNFVSPTHDDFPHLALNWTRPISPTVVNEMRAGWNRNVGDIGANNPGVPEITFYTGEVDFGNYSGYPQIFHEEVFQYSDLVTISHGKHEIKFGGSVERNYENSEFNVGRPSDEFTDSVAFAAGMPAAEIAGTDPGTVNPATGVSQGGAHLASNIRAWRNWEYGAFVNDNYKVTPRLTLVLGLRYDLYTRHTEKYGHGTIFNIPTGGSNLTARLESINCFEDVAGATGNNGQACDGGFQATSGAIAPGDHNDFGPRVGFAWDVLGDGKTSLRGGFGVSYQGEVYNPISNSRWQPPFYSFDLAFCSTGVNNPAPGNTDSCIFGPTAAGVAPSYTGAPSNIGAGPAGATSGAFAGNIQGWNPYNANAAYLTGIILANDFRDPYVYGSQLSLEHQFGGGFVLKTSWVGTFGHKLIRAEDINRYFNSVNLSTGCPGTGDANCIFGHLRTWENSVNSNYNALQVVLDKRLSHNLELHSNYEWSHSMDTRSSWHDAATTSNGAAEGYSEDQALPGLDYGNSIFDVRHRFSLSAVYTLPWFAGQQGFTGHLLGGWQANGIIQLHSGFPWTPYCSSSAGEIGCDFNQDGVSNDRPNQPAFGNHASATSNAAFELGHPSLNLNPAAFVCGIGGAATVPGCSPQATSPGFTPFDGNLGRNTFTGPNFREVDFSLFKNIKFGERANVQFRAEGFNIFNRTNLQQPANQLNTTTTFGLSQASFFPRQIQFGLKLLF
ncbi:MAG TPA: carboxypeptidase-like regulatory domain-containing protein [Terriglobia bacterium]|nr:carboxypeptidase-like regulatory domain-containing protein [Terriglobia bacterium]